MKTEIQVESMLRATEDKIQFERGRSSVFKEQQNNHSHAESQHTIGRLQAVADAYKNVLERGI